MTSRQSSAAPQPGSGARPEYSDIERWTATYPKQCAGCGGESQFVLKDDRGHALTQCSACLTVTFGNNPDMTARVLRRVAERL